MTARSEVVEIARGWLGTPYHHQASVCGIGTDCIGFVKGVALQSGLITADLARSLPTDYSRQQSGGRLRRMLGDLLIAIPDVYGALPADVFLMRIAGQDQHIGLYTDRGIIHCHSDVKGVVEHALDAETRKQIVRSYRFGALA